MAREELKTHDIPADKLQRLRPAAVMTTSKGDITIDLFPKEAPNTVANFYMLASDGYYDGARLSPRDPGFVARGGCPEGTGAGGPGWVIPCETKGNPHKHKTGSLSMAASARIPAAPSSSWSWRPSPTWTGCTRCSAKSPAGLDIMQDLEIGDEIKSVKFTGN